MHDILGALSPSLPVSITEWFHVLALALTGLVKVFRGSVMHRRARRIDFFGWSIIWFDWVFGGALLIATVWAFYPGLHEQWFDIVTTGALVAVALWQGYTVYRAPVPRIDRAMHPQPTEWSPDGPDDRRSGPPRRQVDRDKESELEMYRAIHREHMDGMTT